MKLTPKITRALNKAATLHIGQIRKADGLPYIVHPVSVAMILADYTKDEDVIAAGLLHDTLEDTEYSEEEMREEFGDRVAGFVTEVTEMDKSHPWIERKEAYLAHLEIASLEAKLVCGADKLHNLQSMRDAVRAFGVEIYGRFNAPADKKLWFYEQCVEVFKKDGRVPEELIREIEGVVEEMRKLETK